MKNLRKALSVIFVLALAVSAFSLCTFAADTVYTLPTDDAAINGYNAQSNPPSYFNGSATSDFKLGALDVGTTTLDKASPDFYHIAFKGARDPDYNTLNIHIWGGTNVIFQQGEDFSKNEMGFSKNAFTMMYKVENASHKYVPVIAFTAPEDGNYEFNVSFCKRYNIDNLTSEFYLVKAVTNDKVTTADLANGVIDKYTWEYDTVNHQVANNEHAYTSAANQTLEGTVELKAGEQVWFIAAPKDYAGSNNNQTIVNSFTVTKKEVQVQPNPTPNPKPNPGTGALSIIAILGTAAVATTGTVIASKRRHNV